LRSLWAIFKKASYVVASRIFLKNNKKMNYDIRGERTAKEK